MDDRLHLYEQIGLSGQNGHKNTWEGGAIEYCAKTASVFSNPAFQVRSWYKPIACQIATYMHNTAGKVRLVMNATKLGFHYH